MTLELVGGVSYTIGRLRLSNPFPSHVESVRVTFSTLLESGELLLII
jgi:hypothetical protein